MLTHEEALSIISRAWGRQSGYAFFPWVSGKADNKRDRIASYREGPAFLWPDDKVKILEHMARHEHDDLWWCPSLFEKDRRLIEYAMDEHCLWADLDKTDPHTITDYPPTIAWQTSPGKYQALWLITPGFDIQGASWEGGENQRLTYYLDADPSGWDTTQLLRIPGWRNHKPEYKKKGRKPPLGKLLWKGGRTYLPDEFAELPEVQRLSDLEDVLEDQIDAVDPDDVWGRVRLKVSQSVRTLMRATEADAEHADRSDKLWEIERELADAGCTVSEIVAVVRPSVWNKYAGRHDEMRRLISESAKAVKARDPEHDKAVEEEREGKPTPERIKILLAGVKPPDWLIEDIWVKGGLGFLAGQPKVFKSWSALDMLISICTGQPFLERFMVMAPGRCLYIQEEDPLPTVKARFDKVYRMKLADRMTTRNGSVVWEPAAEEDDLPLDAVVYSGIKLSDEGWQSWLDDTISAAADADDPYTMVCLDPLQLMIGDVDENRTVAMNETILTPLRIIGRKHNCAIALVHHMRKKRPDQGWVRGGEMMLGAQALHAWSENSMYFTLRKGGVHVEVESKHATGGQFTISNLRNKKWEPYASALTGMFDDDDTSGKRGSGGTSSRGRSKANDNGGQRGHDNKDRPIQTALKELGPGPHTRAELQAHMGISSSGVYQQAKRAEKEGLVMKTGNGWQLI